MARGQQETRGQPWDSLEELLLACAVKRHGTRSWDSVSMELQTRRRYTLPCFTPQNCRDKFNDLKRQFMPKHGAESGGLSFIVDELRRIRVEDLRREVQRRDVSIVSLELKVKRLEEERERSLKEEADLKRDGLKGVNRQPSPEIVGGDVSDERDNRSFHESNSSSQKPDAITTAKDGQNDAVEAQRAQVKREPLLAGQPGLTRTGSRPRPDRDCSSNGNVVDRNGIGNDGKSEVQKERKGATRGRRLGEWNELRESVIESKRESEQSSDVQSSASLSKKKRRRKGVAGSSSGEEPNAEPEPGPDGEEVSLSPANKRTKPLKPEPLVTFLGIIRSNRLSSWLERRLRSQEYEKYRKVIRQQMDLQTIKTRLEKGTYTNSFHAFFRDLLLLFTNAIVFHHKNSAKHAAAQQLRSIVLKEMNTHRLRRPPRPSPVTTVKTHPIPNLPNRTSSKPDTHCLEAKPEVVVSETVKKKMKKKVDGSGTGSGGSGEEEKGLGSKRKSSTVTYRRNSRRSGRSGSSTGSGESKLEYGNNELSSHDALDNKRKRMKLNSSSTEKACEDEEEGGRRKTTRTTRNVGRKRKVTEEKNVKEKKGVKMETRRGKGSDTWSTGSRKRGRNKNGDEEDDGRETRLKKRTRRR